MNTGTGLRCVKRASVDPSNDAPLLFSAGFLAIIRGSRLHRRHMTKLKVKPATVHRKAIHLASSALFFLVLFPGDAAFAQLEPGPLPVRQVAAALDSLLYEYAADRVVDDIATGRVVFTGNVVLKYQDVELRAGRIVLHREVQRLEAEALPDSTGRKTIGMPEFIRGAERFTGSSMVYNLETGRGRVRGGRARHGRRYYRGEQILLDQQRELHARTISMSSCDRDHTHYDFLCQALKVVENDKAIARSVTFRVGPVPLLWLPFYVFPLTQGRRSGILTPRIGSNSRDGVNVSNIGYYWAPSDYWDATLRTALRERNGFLVDAGIDYAVRKRLSGYMNLSYERERQPSGDSRRDWRLNFHHQHRLNPTLNMRARGDFTNSSSFDLHNANNLYRYLNRQLRSSFSIDKRWTEARRSMDLNLNYYRDLDQNQNRFQGFPRLSFRQGRRRILGQPESNREALWYHAFYYDVSGGLSNAFTRNEDRADNTHNLTLNSRLGVSSQHRPFGLLDLTHRFNISQTSSRLSRDARTRRESYNVSLAAGNALYGIFQPQVGRLRGIRHRFQPQIDFRYYQNATVDGATLGFHGRRDWNDPRRALNLRLNNTIEIKTEVDGKVRRSTFATASFSTGYDFDTNPTRKWRDLRTSASIKPARRIDVRLNMTHTFYDALDRLNLYRPHLRSLTVNTSLRFSGRTEGRSDRLQYRGSMLPAEGTGFNFEDDVYRDFGNATQPWHFNLGHYFSHRESFTTGSGSTRRSWVKADLALNPTRAWRFNYSVNFDLVNTRLISQTLYVYRDLHCWQATFSWYPTGFNKGFHFKLNIKDFPQIKLEHRRGGFGL